MKNLKSILALVLSCLLIVGMLPMGVGAVAETITWMAGWDATNNPEQIHYTLPDNLLQYGIGAIGNDYGDQLIINNHQVNYSITTAQTGYYALKLSVGNPSGVLGILVDDVEKLSYTVETYYSGSGYAQREELEIGVLYFEANTPTKLSIKKKSGGIFNLKECYLTFVEPIAFQEASIAEGDTVARGTDCITLTYDHDLEPLKLSDATVTVTNNETAAEVPVTLAVDDADSKTLVVALGATLEYGAGYTLTAEGVTDTYGMSSESVSIGFTTSDEAGDNAAKEDSVTITSITEVGGTFTVTGMVRGCRNQVIAGRVVTGSVLVPDATEAEELASVVSDEEGIFTLTYTVAEGAESGTYTFTVGGEYVAADGEATDDKAFVSEREKQEILGALDAAADAAAAETVISANATLLGVNLEELSVLSDTSLFYERIAAADFTNENGELDMNLVDGIWNNALALERLNQGNSDAVTEEVIESGLLDLDFTDYNELTGDAKAKLITAITLLPRQADAETFAALFAEMAEDAIAVAGASTPIQGAADSFFDTFGTYIQYDQGWVTGDNISTGDTSKWAYKVTPPVAGAYMVSMNLGTSKASGATVKLFVDEGQGEVEQATVHVQTDTVSSRSEFDLGVVVFNSTEEASLIFQCVAGTAGIYANYYKLTYLSPNSFAGIEANGEALENGDTIPCAIDAFTVTFANALDAEQLADATIEVWNADDSESSLLVGYELDAENNKKLNVMLMETLEEDASYIVNIANVADLYGTASREVSLDFATVESDMVNGMVVIDELSLADKTFTVKGALKGSAGQIVAGREMTASVTCPNRAAENIASFVSDSTGEFTVTYTIVEDENNDASGEYVFTVSGEHAEAATQTLRYVSEGKKTEILGALETEEDTRTIIEANQGNLGLDLSVLDVFTDETVGLFYDRLADASYKDENGAYSMEVFDTVWNASYALERISQGDSVAATQAVLESEAPDYAAALGLDMELYNALSEEQKPLFLQDVTDLPSQESAEAFSAEFSRLANDNLLEQYDKADAVLSLNNQSIYTGATADIDLNLATEVTNISGYTLVVDCGDEDAAGRVDLTAPEGAVVDKTEDEGVVTFVVTNIDTEKIYDNLGTLEYNSSPVEIVDMTVSGTLTYTVGEDALALTAAIEEDEVRVTVTKNTNKGGGGTTSSRGGSMGGAISSVPVVTPNLPEDSDNDNGEPFDDLHEIAWATPSILALHNKGVISDSADRRFRPADNVTRAEFVKMLVACLGIQEKATNVSLSDVSEDAWFYPYIASAVYYGLVQGDENGNFRPDDSITRQDICVILSRAMDKLGYGPAEMSEVFTDDSEIAAYAKEAVYRLRAHEIVNGMGDGSFAPKANANRAMTAKMLEEFTKEAGI